MISSLYKTDPVELPRYTLSEVAHYLHITKHSLKKWISGEAAEALGAAVQKPLIQRPDPGDPRLSFANLLEAYIISFSQYLKRLNDVGRGGEGEVPEILESYFQRIEWGPSDIPLRIFPITRLDYRNASKLICIDPVVAFGRPILERMGIKTSTIAERFNAGESIRAIAEDYYLETFEIEEALRYEGLGCSS